MNFSIKGHSFVRRIQDHDLLRIHYWGFWQYDPLHWNLLYGSKEIIIGILLRRLYIPMDMPYNEYEEKRKTIKQMLQEEFNSASHFFFWKTRDLVDTSKECYLQDWHCKNQIQLYVHQIKLALVCKFYFVECSCMFVSILLVYM